MIRPGLVALLLVALLGFSLGLAPLKSHRILEDAYSQVFVVACDSGYGTGWWVNSQGYAVTAAHVVAGCQHLVGIRGAWRSNLTIVAINTTLDVAVLKAENVPGWAKGIPLSFKVAVGDPIYVVGYPIQLYQETQNLVAMSEIPRVASGTVSWIHPTKPVFQFDVATDAGNSGGPVISRESGGAVGLVVYARPGIVSEGYFGLRMDALASFLSQHHVEYHVAGGPSRMWLLGGLGLVAVLIFLEIRGGKRVPKY